MHVRWDLPAGEHRLDTAATDALVTKPQFLLPVWELALELVVEPARSHQKDFLELALGSELVLALVQVLVQVLGAVQERQKDQNFHQSGRARRSPVEHVPEAFPMEKLAVLQAPWTGFAELSVLVQDSQCLHKGLSVAEKPRAGSTAKEPQQRDRNLQSPVQRQVAADRLASEAAVLRTGCLAAAGVAVERAATEAPCSTDPVQERAQALELAEAFVAAVAPSQETAAEEAADIAAVVAPAYHHTPAAAAAAVVGVDTADLAELRTWVADKRHSERHILLVLAGPGAEQGH